MAAPAWNGGDEAALKCGVNGAVVTPYGADGLGGASVLKPYVRCGAEGAQFDAEEEDEEDDGEEMEEGE